MLKLGKKVRNLVFIVEGGIGKNIMGTAVVRALKKQFPDKDIIVVAGYPDVFMNNPNVKKVFNFNNPLYFYEDYVNDASCVLKCEPYVNYDYINGNKHLVTVWCEMLGIKIDGIEPDLYFTPNELKAAEMYVNKITNNKKKDLVFLQWIGGKTPQDKSPEQLQACLASMYRRSLTQNIAQSLVDKLKNLDYVVGVVGHENFPELNNAEKIAFPLRNTLALLKYGRSFIGIDSFLQHACAAKQIDVKGLVTWGGTNPAKLGYDKHANYVIEPQCNNPMCHRPNSYLFDTQTNGNMWDCQHGDACMKAFNSSEIMDKFETILGIVKAIKEE